MPEYEALLGLPTHLDCLLKTDVIESKLNSHLNGAFKGAEMRAMQVVDELVQGQERDSVMNLKLKLGVLCSDLGKTGGANLPENLPFNVMVESVYAIKDHQMNPDQVTFRQFLETQQERLRAEYMDRIGENGSATIADSNPDFDNTLAQLCTHYGFSEDISLRDFYNHHVEDSLATLDRAWQEIVEKQPEILNDEIRVNDFQEVRKIVALHHAYRFIPEGYSLEDVNTECLYAMAADIYDAVLSRPPLQGYNNSHESAISMIEGSLNKVVRLQKPSVEKEELEKTISDIIQNLNSKSANLIRIFNPPAKVPEDADLKYFSGDKE